MPKATAGTCCRAWGVSLYLDIGALLLLRFPFSMSVFLNRSEFEHTVCRLASFIEF